MSSLLLFVKHPNELPVIIDSPGEYLTRNGRKVIIHSIASSTNPEHMAFTAKGSLQNKKGNRWVFNTWHVSGRNIGIGESPKDVIDKFNK